MCVCVCVGVWVCACACVRACVRACVWCVCARDLVSTCFVNTLHENVLPVPCMKAFVNFCLFRLLVYTPLILYVGTFMSFFKL